MKATALRPLALGVAALAVTVLLFGRAQAGDDDYYAPVTDARTLQECASCDIAFPPSMLPAASWKRMMGELENHFGDDASLDTPQPRSRAISSTMRVIHPVRAASCCAACALPMHRCGSPSCQSGYASTTRYQEPTGRGRTSAARPTAPRATSTQRKATSRTTEGQ